MTVPSDVPTLIKWLRKRDPVERVYAATALATLGDAAEAALPELALLVKDSNAEVATAAVRALRQIGPATIPVLIEALEHPGKTVRREAVWTLKMFGSQACEAVPALTRALEDPDLRVRLAATHALGFMGPTAEWAIPELIQLLKASHVIQSRLAAEALGRIGDAALPALTDQLQSHDAHVRREAAWAIRHIIPDLPSIDSAIRESALSDDTHIPGPVAKDDGERTVQIAAVPREHAGAARAR